MDSSPLPTWQRVASRVLRAVKADPYGDLFERNTNVRLRKLLSPRYLVARVALAIHERRNPDVPWITRDAVEMLELLLNRTQVGFEWGSGNGTSWLLARCKSLTSVEHHRAWYETVRRRLSASGVANADYRHVEETNYTDVIDSFPDEHFDWIIVDGLFRDVAMSKSMAKVKPGGFIVLDNANWYLPSDSTTPQSRSIADGPASELWRQVGRALESWRQVWTTNGVNDTAFFFKK